MLPLTQILIHSSFILFLLVFHHFFHHFFSNKNNSNIKGQKLGYNNLVVTFGKFQIKLKCKHNVLRQSSTCQHIQNIAFKQ